MLKAWESQIHCPVKWEIIHDLHRPGPPHILAKLILKPRLALGFILLLGNRGEADVDQSSSRALIHHTDVDHRSPGLSSDDEDLAGESSGAAE